jgi:hypothetical protein
MMPKSVWPCVFVGVAVLALQGCNKVQPTLQVHTGKTGGVTYEIRGTGHATESRSANGDVDVTLGSNHLQIKGGQVVANGKSCGAVKDGDRVVLDDKGQVSIVQEHR